MCNERMTKPLVLVLHKPELPMARGPIAALLHSRRAIMLQLPHAVERETRSSQAAGSATSCNTHDVIMARY